MAHKNNSKEQFKKQFFFFKITFKNNINISKTLNFNQILLIILLLKKNFFFYETNLFFLKSFFFYFVIKKNFFFNLYKFIN